MTNPCSKQYWRNIGAISWILAHIGQDSRYCQCWRNIKKRPHGDIGPILATDIGQYCMQYWTNIAPILLATRECFRVNKSKDSKPIQLLSRTQYFDVTDSETIYRPTVAIQRFAPACITQQRYHIDTGICSCAVRPSLVIIVPGSMVEIIIGSRPIRWKPKFVSASVFTRVTRRSIAARQVSALSTIPPVAVKAKKREIDTFLCVVFLRSTNLPF